MKLILVQQTSCVLLELCEQGLLNGCLPSASSSTLLCTPQDDLEINCVLSAQAIDLVDEAGSRVRLRHIQLPEEARDLDKELKQVGWY